MVRVNLKRKSVSVVLIAFVLLFAIPTLGLSQEEKKDLRPERVIVIYPEFS